MNKLVFVFLVAFSTNSFSQDMIIDKPTTRWDMFKFDMGNVIKGVGYSYTRPLHWKGKQWGDFGLTMAGIRVAYLIDEPTSEYFCGIKEDVPEFIRDFGFKYGSPSNNYMLTGAVYATGLIIKNEKLR